MFSRGGVQRSRPPVTAPELARAANEQAECDVVLTRDHEYFVLSGICVAVRDRVTGRFVRQDLSNGVASLHRGYMLTHGEGSGRAGDAAALQGARSLPRVGEWLCLERGGTVHYVGPVLGCERRRLPARRIVEPVLRRVRFD